MSDVSNDREHNVYVNNNNNNNNLKFDPQRLT